MVKAYSTRLVATGLRNKIGSRSLILTLQNGLGNVEVLSKVFGGQVLAGSTTEASLRLGLGVIERIGRGLTVIGAVDEKHSSRVHDVVKMLKSAGFKSRPTSHIPSVVWSKAILNSAINPISAVTRLPNGQLTKIEGLRSLMLEVLGEGSRVARANGVTLRVEQLSRLLTKVLKSSARNHSSMLEDVLNSRKTEVRELNGIIAKLGRRRGVKARLNKVLTDLVLGIESSYAG